jgi:hypothetical protein
VAWIVRLVSVGADGTEHSTDVLHIPRPDTLADLASLGLTLAESKQLLAGVQQAIVAAQARIHAALRPECRNCGTACRMKDYRQHEIATLFGQVTVRLPPFPLCRMRHDRGRRGLAATRPLDLGAGPVARPALRSADLPDRG